MRLALQAAIVKEWVSFMHDKTSLRMLLGAPILQMFIFAFAANMEVSNVNIAVLDRDDGRWSQELTARVVNAGFVSDVIHIKSMEEFSDLVDRRQVLLALQYPEDFSRKIARGETATLQVIVDGRRANAGQIAMSYLRSIAAQFGAEVNGSASPSLDSQAVVRQWFNPNLNYQWFIVPALSGMMPLTITFIMATLSIAREREMGTFDQMLVSPLSPFGIILSKTIPALFAGCFVAAAVLLLSIFFFEIAFQGDFLFLALGVVIFLLAVIGIGLSISALCETQQQSLMGAFSLMAPMVVLSGFLTPVENMPEWLQLITPLDPLTHMVALIQGVYLKAMPWENVVGLLQPLVLIAALTMTAATLILRVRLH
jgi:ABC-2 type transport system permease protein